MSNNLQQFISHSVIPPGKYRFTVPENGYKIEGLMNRGEWLKAIRDHYISNNIPLPENYEAIADDQLCRQMPPGVCRYGDGTPARGMSPVLAAEAIIHGLESLKKAVEAKASGEPIYVAQEEANRRADICARCWNNMTTSFCAGCHAMYVISGLVSNIRGKRTTPVDDRLLTCGSCGCRTQAIVHFQKDILLSGEKPEITNDRPDWCWLKENS